MAAIAHRASREFDADERGSGVYQTRAVSKVAPALTPPLVDAEARARVVAFLRERPASLPVAANEIDIPIDFVDDPGDAPEADAVALVFRSLLWK